MALSIPEGLRTYTITTMGRVISDYSDNFTAIDAIYRDYDSKVSLIISASTEMISSCSSLKFDIQREIRNIQADRATVTQYKIDLYQGAYDYQRQGGDIRYGYDGHDISGWDNWKPLGTFLNPDWTARNFANDIVQSVPFADELAYLATREEQANALLTSVENFENEVKRIKTWASDTVPKLARLIDFNMRYVQTAFRLSMLQTTLGEYLVGIHSMDEASALTLSTVDQRVTDSTQGLSDLANDIHYETQIVGDENGNGVKDPGEDDFMETMPNAYAFETNDDVDYEDKELFGGNIDSIVPPHANTVEELVAIRNELYEGGGNMYMGEAINEIDRRLLALGFVASVDENYVTVLTSVAA